MTQGRALATEANEGTGAYNITQLFRRERD